MGIKVGFWIKITLIGTCRYFSCKFMLVCLIPSNWNFKSNLKVVCTFPRLSASPASVLGYYSKRLNPHNVKLRRGSDVKNFVSKLIFSVYVVVNVYKNLNFYIVHWRIIKISNSYSYLFLLSLLGSIYLEIKFLF